MAETRAGTEYQVGGVILWRFGLVAGVFIAQGAIELVVFESLYLIFSAISFFAKYLLVPIHVRCAKPTFIL